MIRIASSVCCTQSDLLVMSKFFSRFKGEREDRSDLNPSSSFASNNPYRNEATPTYSPPQTSKHEHASHSDLGSTSAQVDSASLSNREDPPPYHDWTVIPDTALLPPPPSMVSDYSSTTNASYDDAAAAHAWCASHLVYRPQDPPPAILKTVAAGAHALIPHKPWTISTITPSMNVLNALPAKSLRVTSSKSKSTLVDVCWTTQLPLYLASVSNPMVTGRPTVVYYEITPRKFQERDATVAIGVASLPYPPNRQPGWHRASIGVHSDDGNRYINDSWGGRPFTQPFSAGESIGLAVQIFPEAGMKDDRRLQSDKEVHSDLPQCRTRVYLVRNGSVAGSWDVDEERDAEKDEGIAGLRGESDLYAAIGTYGHVDFDVAFYRDGEGFVPPPI